jgi:hypothetical protein
MVMVDEGIWRRCEDLYEIDSCAGSPSYIYILKRDLQCPPTDLNT